MCLFPFSNTMYESQAYKKGLREFDCGACPECLSKRSRLWALRCCAESFYNEGVMVTLTYDQIKRDESGNIIYDKRTGLPLEEVDTRPCSKRDCQLFIKRLRKHFKNQKIKYLLCAEHGSRTNRSHYHCILFGVQFSDLVFHKRSKRGNRIYMSNTLNKLWKFGVCTVDAINLNGKIARYCTKYCAKDTRCNDAFMLVSRGIGDRWLLEHFNGISYYLDGMEYSIPKLIWNKVIEYRYRNNYIFKKHKATYKYRALSWFEKNCSPNPANYFSISKYIGSSYMWTPKTITFSMKERRRKFCSHEERFTLCANACADLQKRRNKIFRNFRDSDKQYQNYLEYWNRKAENMNRIRPDSFTRILQLPNDKYFTYKQACLTALINRKKRGESSCLVPRSNCFGRYERYVEDNLKRIYGRLPAFLVNKGQMTPDERKREYKVWQINGKYVDLRQIDIPNPPEVTQISIF